MRSEGELAIEAYLTPQTSHEGGHCQASGSSDIPLHSRIRCARVRSFIATQVDSNWLPAANGKSRDANQLLQSATRHCRCHPNRLRRSRDWAVLTRRCSSNIAARQRTPFPGEAADPALAREASHAGRTFLWKIKALETEWDSFCFAVSHTFSK